MARVMLQTMVDTVGAALARLDADKRWPTWEDVAAARGTGRVATQRVLRACVEAGLLGQEGDRYYATPRGVDLWRIASGAEVSP